MSVVCGQLVSKVELLAHAIPNDGMSLEELYTKLLQMGYQSENLAIEEGNNRIKILHVVDNK